MGGTKKRDLQATHAEDDGEETLIKLGKQLLGLQKTSKDAVLKPLKVSSGFPPNFKFQFWFQLNLTSVQYLVPAGGFKNS
jgi:hypothetical protein